MSQIGLGGGTVSILLVAWNVFRWLNHRSIKSKCCGRTLEVELDVSTPSNVKPEPVVNESTEPVHTALHIRTPEGVQGIHRGDIALQEASGTGTSDSTSGRTTEGRESGGSERLRIVGDGHAKSDSNA